MAVAVKNSPETSTTSALDRIPVISLVGLLYVLGSLAIVFKLVPTLWERLWSGLLGLDSSSAGSLTLQGIVMLAVATGLIVLGGRLLGPKTQVGVRAGIFVALVEVLFALLLTRWFSLWVEHFTYYEGWFGPSGQTVGAIVTAVFGLGLLLLLARWFFRPGMERFLVAFEEQGWFTATAYKKNQGQKVRRGTILGILLLTGAGIYTMVSHNTLARGSENWELIIPFTGKVVLTQNDLGDAEALLAAKFPERAASDDPNNIAWFRLTDPALASAQKAGVPEAVIAKLSALKDKGFSSESRFRAALEEALDKEEFKESGPILVRQATLGPLVVNRYVLRDIDDQVDPAAYVKIDNPAGIVSSKFKDGEIVPKKAYDEEKRNLGEKDDYAKPPVPAWGTVKYAMLPLLPGVKFTVPLLLLALSLWFAWRVVNLPVFADFLIATEAELNKVSWTTRKRLYQDTIVVLVTVLLLAGYLFAMDQMWGAVLSWRPIGVLVFDKNAAEHAKGSEQKPW